MEIPRKPLPTRVAETPDLPPAYVDALERGLDELGLGLAPDVRSAIDGHARLLLAWTGSINLTGDPGARRARPRACHRQPERAGAPA